MNQTLFLPARTAPRPGTPTVVETIASLQGIRSLRGDWADLLADSAADSLFLTWEWLSTWSKHLAGARRLSIVTVRSRGELIGLAPLAVTAGRRASLAPFPSLTFLGTGSVGSDYLDVVIARGREAEALDGLARGLAGQGRALQLAQVRHRTSAAAQLASRLAARGWRCVERATDICPFIPLAGLTWPAYLASLGGHHRSNFRRRLANLEKAFDVRFERAETEDERAAALETFFALHDRRWGERGGSNAMHSAALRGFHEEWTRLALDRNWLRLFVMRLDGRPVGAIYGFRYGTAFGFYQTGFDPAYARHGIGQVMIGLTIKSAIEEGALEYDLLHGNEPYKSDWARGSRELARIEAYPPSPMGRLHARLAEWDQRSRRAARRVLGGIRRGSP
jgi:CelD/BcsL family acetyltransferase involved in cellulose biosynthesis